MNETGYYRDDAIKECTHLSQKFIEHFKHIVDNNYAEDSDFNHHCAEMQFLFDVVNNIVLKHNKKKIYNNQLINWFFTREGSVKDILEEPYQDIYDDFMIRVLFYKNINQSFNDILNKKLVNSKLNINYN